MNPGARRGTFTINGSPLLMDFTAPYTFTIDSTRWGDGTYTIAASATMRDNFITAAASATVTVANGRVNPPPNTNQWTPTAGTSPAPGAPLVLAATGDGADGAPGAASTVNRIASWNPNLFLYLGDVYEDGTPMEFNNWYGQSGTASTYGQFRSITDPVIGNHEYIGNNASGYFYYWDNIPHYYSFNSHGWHFIALDSTSQFGQTAVGSGQYNWLANDLAANTSACTVVYYHHPILNVGPEGSTTSMTAMWQLFAQHHVTLVLNGHDHDYQRFEPVDGNLNPSSTGITEIIVGSGGHGTQGLLTPDPKLVASDFADLGALRMNLFPTSATFQFQTPTGSVVDSGLIPCQNTNDTVAPIAPGGVSATPNGPGEIDLSWSASTDNVAVAGYEIYKDGATTPLATLAPDALAYTDQVVAPNTTHSYIVKAFDAAGNRSLPGGPASATTPDGTVTLVLVPAADAYVNSDLPTINYGGADVLRVASPVTGSTATMYSYLRFDLSNVVGRIQSASLSMLAGATSSLPFAASGVSDNTWDEYAMTFSTAPPIGSSVGTSGPLTLGSWSSVDVGALTAAGQGHLLSIGLTRTGSQVPFSSRETTTPPKLTIVVGSGTPAAPSASFSASVTTTYNGVPIQLTDTSTGSPPTAWNWDFGDTITSTLQNPIHAWSTPGTYTVSLVTSNIYGSSAPATAQITVVADTTPPSAPGNVAAAAIGPGEIDLGWSASTDNIAVTSYVIRKDGATTPLATVTSDVLSYHDMVVAPNSTHSYTVEAIDAAGNHSVAGGPAWATTPGGTVTYVLTPLADSYVDNQFSGTNFGTSTSLRVKNSSPAITNSYLRFDLSNVVGSIQSASLSLLSNSTTGAQFSVSGVTDNTWGETTINYTNAPGMGPVVGSSGPVTATSRASVDVATLVATAQGGPVSFGLTGSGTQINLSSRETATSPQLTIVVGPGTQSAPVASFTPSATTVFDGDTVNFTDTSTGNPTAWSWDFGDGTSTLASPSHSWPTPGTYTVTLVSTNTYGSSAPATSQITVNADTTPPSVPGAVAAGANGPGEIDVSWTASTDDRAVTGYDVYRDGAATPLAIVTPPVLLYQDKVVAPGSTHSYTVQAFDAAGNHSIAGGPATATSSNSTVTYVLTPAADSYVDAANPGANNGSDPSVRVQGTPNTLSSYLRFDLTNVVGHIQSASLSLVPSANSGTGYSMSGVSDNTWGETTITYTNRPPMGAIVASSGALTANVRGSANATTLVTAAQGGLVSIGLTTTGGQISLASKETPTPPQLTIVVGPGPQGIPTASFTSSATTVFNGDPVTFTDTSTGNPTAWSWGFGDGTSTLASPSHSWPTPGTYTVSLVATNTYGPSAPATAQISVVADTTPPSVPSAVAATANGPGEIDVSWTASTDDRAVTGYEIYKDGSTTPLATIAADVFSYQDKVVAPSSTHAYTVEAFDAAGNRSAAGGPSSATTPAGTVTYVLNPVADSYVDNQNIATNFGGNATLRVKNSSGLVMNSYLRFNLSNVVGSVQSASLSVVSNTTSNTSGFGVSSVSDNGWLEAAINWSNAPGLGASVGTSGPLTAGSPSSVNVSTLVALAQGGPVSFSLTGSGSEISLASRETATPPQLTIVVESGPQGAPVASFDASATTAPTGGTVTFTDTSTGNPTTWSWDFGDGATSAVSSPSHSWSAAGTYTVTQVATNVYGSSAPASTQITITADTPPSPPGNVVATAIGPGEIDVSWDVSTDDLAVTGYEVYRDGSVSPLATLGPVVSYQDAAVAPNSTHSYTVVAFDAAANHSTAGGPASATTPDGTVTYVLTPVADSYVDAVNTGTNHGTATSVLVRGTPSALNGYLRFDLSNVIGRIQSASLSLVPTAGSTVGFSASGVPDNTWGELTIDYANAPPMGSVVGSSGALIANTRGNVNVGTVVAPAQGGLVSLGLTTTGGQINLASRETVTPPQLTIVVGSGTPGVPTASFDASHTTQIAGLSVQYTDTSTGNPPTAWSWNFGDGTPASTVQNPIHTWSTAGTYTVTLVATNIYGSSPPATSSITINADTYPPGMPTGVTATASGSTAIDVAWASSADDVALAGYSVYRDGGSAPIAIVGSTTLSLHDTPLVRGSTHTYTVDAFDAAGNHSALSSPPASATTNATQTFVLTPVADSYVDSVFPTVKNGLDVALRVRSGSLGEIMNSYMRFDLSGVSGTVQSASLSLVPAISTGAKFTAHGVGDNTWGETAIDYTNAPPMGQSAGISGSLTAGVRASVDVGTLVAPAEGSLLSIGLTGAGTQTPFGSRETANPPQLTIVVGPDSQPSFPIRAAFYYPWFPEAWNQQTFNPFTMYEPTLGYYDSSASTTLTAHLAALQYGKIDVGISSWWGQGTPTDNRLPQILAATAGTPTRWSVYYESEGNNDPSVSQITSDLTYLRDHYGRDPSYLRVNGHFVVFVYTGGSDTCSMVDRWTQANAGIGAYIVLKVITGYKTCANQPNGWHQYAPALAEDSRPGYSYAISPGFNKPGEAGPRLVRDVSRWYGNVRDMIASAAPWQLVTTFSEWGEGTSVEDATEWQSASGYGDYLDALHGNGQAP